MMKLLLISVMVMALTAVVGAYESTATPVAGNDAYVVNVSTMPDKIEANKPFTLTVTIFESDGKTPVVAFDEVHTKLLHFILVSQDLTQFLHVHPDYQGNGVFVLKDLILPDAANYVTYADFTPTGKHQQYARDVLNVVGATDQQASLAAGPRGVTVGDLTVSLDSSVTYDAGVETSLTFHVTSAKTGESIDNLDEFLGAAGHLVIIDQTNQVYIHTHPAGHEMMDMSGMSSMATPTQEMMGMVMPMQYGPDLEFMTRFPSAGYWAMWLQVQYKGEVYTFPFVIEVTSNTESTPQAHAHG